MNRKPTFPINPFEYQERPKYSANKRRDYSDNNPFFSSENDTHEISFNGTIKLKTVSRPSHGINPFENYSKKKIEELPFHKGESKCYSPFKRLNANNYQSSIANSSKGEKQLIINPNFNIYICDKDFFAKNEHTNPFASNSIENKIDSFSVINNTISEEKRQEKEINLTESLCAAAPAIDPVIDLTERVEKLKLDDGRSKKQRKNKLWKQSKKKDNEKIYTNDGSCTLGENYF